MDIVQKKKMKKMIIGFCALIATIPLATIAVGLHKDNHGLVKLGVAESILMGMFIGLSDSNPSQKKKTQQKPERERS